jgi:hypothetical protein
MLARPEVQSYWYSFAGSIALVFASGVGLCLGQPQLRGERRFERPRRGTEDQGRPARARNGGTGGRLRWPGQGEARGVRPPHHAVLSRGKAERWPLADLALQTGDHLPIRQPVYEVGGRRFRGALLPTEIHASREPGRRLNPQLRRIPAEMPADLTRAEIAKSGSYFDDVTRHPRPYSIENTTDKSPTRTEGSKRRSAKKYVRAGRRASSCWSY